ncbi:MAG: exo-alpha-sialidase [Bacteroides sp.]|nr:exo-alpha-sialidase [Bacteroides sp.]
MTTFPRILALLSASMAWFGASADDKVIEISLLTGSLDSPSGYSQSWTSTDSSPGLVMTASRKDMAPATDGVNLDMREGSSGTSTYTLSPSAGWRVSEITLSFVGNNDKKPVTVSSAGQKLVSSSEVQTLTVSPGKYDTAAITLSGQNEGITTTAFRVTLSEVEPEPSTPYIINMESGELTSRIGTFYKMWQSPDVYLTSNAANMAVGSDGTSLDLREGSSGTGTYYISTNGSRRVSGFELTFVANDASKPVTVSVAGKELTATSEPQTLIVNNLTYGQVCSFTLTGANAGILATDFKALLTETSPVERGVNVFTHTGFDPYATVYRIPVVAYIPAGPKAGRLVAVNDFRPCGADIGYGEVDLHVSYSDDGGFNWTAPFDPVDAAGNHVADGDGEGTPATSNENRDCGFGDPSLVADCESGDLLMMGVCGRIPIGQCTREIPQGLAIWHSRDGGETWTQWKDITEYILGLLDDKCQYGRVDGLFFTAGRMVQSKYVKVGSHYRVYVVAGGRSASKVDTQCWVFYTDDFGETWNVLGDPMKPALTTGGAEPKCEELPDGSVLFSGRASGGVRTWNIFSFTDVAAGEGYWDTAAKGAMASGAASCNGDALILPVKDTETGAAAYLLLQSTPCHSSARVNVGVNYKVLAQGYDDFGTAKNIAADWDGFLQVTSLPSAYSSLTLMADGTIGFIYEESTFGRDYCEVYRNLTVEEITAGHYTYAPDEDYQTALRLTSEMVAGRLARAEKSYKNRTELLETLRAAAEAFNVSPSAQAYQYFNAAYNAVKTNTPLEDSSISAIEASAEPTRYVDLLGRPVASPRPGSLLINQTTRRVELR